MPPSAFCKFVICPYLSLNTSGCGKFLARYDSLLHHTITVGIDVSHPIAVCCIVCCSLVRQNPPPQSVVASTAPE